MQVRAKPRFPPVPGRDSGNTDSAPLAERVKNPLGDILLRAMGIAEAAFLLRLNCLSILLDKSCQYG